MESYYHEKDSDVLIIKSKGGLDDSLAIELVNDLNQHIDKGLRKIIIDCSTMDFISSLDLSVLARIRAKIAQKGGDVKLCAVKGMVREVLQITRLDTVFEIHPDLEAARQAFASTDESAK